VPAYALFPRTRAAEKVTDTFRTTLSHEGLGALQHNYAVLRGLGAQFIDRARPELAARLGLSTAEFDRLAAQRFPTVAQAVRDVPPAVALVDPVIPRLKAAEHDFSEIDAIPGLGLPVTVLPWLLLGLGATFVGAGAVALRSGSAGAIAVTLGLGAAVVVGAFAFHLPAKFRATDRILPVARVSLSQKAADTATHTVNLVDRLVPEVEQKLVPALAEGLHTTPAAVGQLVAQRYPAVARGLKEWPSISPSAAQLAAAQRATVDDLRRGDGAPFETLPWLAIGPAALAALAAGTALLARPRVRSRRAAVPA
jgi:hypothetical protein